MSVAPQKSSLRSPRVTPERFRTKAHQVFMLRNEPVNFIPGQFMLVARVKDFFDRRHECLMVYTKMRWERLSSEEYIRRFQQVPPSEVGIDAIGTCTGTWDLDYGEISGMYIDRQKLNVATDQLLSLILENVRNPKRSRNVIVTRNRGRLQLNPKEVRKLITPAPIRVHTPALRRLLEERNLLPSTVAR